MDASLLDLLLNLECEPAVINSELICKAVCESNKSKEPKMKIEPSTLVQSMRLGIDDKKDENTVDFNKVECLLLEFSSILRIGHLWMCTSLKVLNLSNNIISKIENLNGLINLEELNLSFNKIKIIENLEGLPKLERLYLYKNSIEQMEGLEPLKDSLTFLSLGKNKILVYLRKFKNLTMLVLEGNPFELNEKIEMLVLPEVETEEMIHIKGCTEEFIFMDDSYKDKTFRKVVTALCQQVVFFDYKIIDEEEKTELRERFLNVIEDLETIENEESRLNLEQEKKKAQLGFIRSSYIEFMEEDDFYRSIIAGDDKGTILMNVSEQIKDVFENLADNLRVICKQFCDIAKDYRTKRFNCLEHYEEECRNIKNIANHEVEVLLRSFKLEKVTMIKQIHESWGKISEEKKKKLRNVMKQVLVIDKDFSILKRKNWWSLMDIEMRCLEKKENQLLTFEDNLEKLVSSFLDAINECFSNMRDIEEEFQKALTDQINKFITGTIISKNENLLDPQIKKILMNKDVLHQHTRSSHESHLDHIDNREEIIIHKVKRWQKKIIIELNESTVQENRKSVLLIRDFTKITNKQWSDNISPYMKKATDYLLKKEPKWVNDTARLKMTKEERIINNQMRALVAQKEVQLKAEKLAKQEQKEYEREMRKVERELKRSEALKSKSAQVSEIETSSSSDESTEFDRDVRRNVQRFVNVLKIRMDPVADSIWETWSSPDEK